MSTNDELSLLLDNILVHFDAARISRKEAIYQILKLEVSYQSTPKEVSNRQCFADFLSDNKLASPSSIRALLNGDFVEVNLDMLLLISARISKA